jgi:tetratricopeptide (TPR) repeat protein
MRTVLLIAGLACGASTAFAQSAEEETVDMTQPVDGGAPAKDPKAVKTWQAAGDTLIKKGDALAKQGKADEAKTIYVNAATAYQKAIEASDDPTPLQLLLATALEKAGDPAGAMKALKPVVAQTANVDLAKKAQSRLDELSMKVGIVSLTVIPEGAQVALAGVTIGEAPLPEPLVLAPGTHTVTFTAVGYQPRDVELKIEAGSESERKIELEPVPIVVKPAETQPEVAPVIEPEKPSMLPMYVGGGAAVGLVLIGSITGIAAVSKQNQYDEATSASERSDIRSSGKALALVTDLCFVGAVGAAAFTTYWYLYKYRPAAKALAEREAARHHKRTSTLARAKVEVVPWVQPETAGIFAVGSF